MLQGRRTQYSHLLRGNGLEIGGLNNPLPLPEGVSARYSDVLTGEEIDRLHPGSKHPDIISNSEIFPEVVDAEFDFVVANHVIEHITDPIGALVEWGRILKESGVLFMAIPDRRFTFDRNRQRTPLAHLIDDHRVRASLPEKELNFEHLKDWATHVEGLRPGSVEWTSWVEREYEQGYSVHNHVWEIQDIFRLLAHVIRSQGVPYKLLEFNDTPWNDIEFILILKKDSTIKVEAAAKDFASRARRCEWVHALQRPFLFLHRDRLRNCFKKYLKSAGATKVGSP